MKNSGVKSGGGFRSIAYSFKMAKKAGGFIKFYNALRSKNTCKTCAFGMGGLAGGMVNEIGESLQICKKSMQAQAQDMQVGIPEEVFVKNSIEDLKKLSGHQLESLGRIIQPMFLPEGSTHFQILSWDDAKNKLLDEWRQADPKRSFFYTSGRSSMEAAFLVQLLARQWGTNNVNNCSYYCHQASGVGLAKSLGGGTSTVALEDIGKSDLVVLIGANPASNHPRLMTFLAELRKRSGHVVVINPFKEVGLQNFSVPSKPGSLLFGSEIASLYLQPHCGGDLAFLKAAAVYLWREGKVDQQFLKNYCNEFDGFKNDLEKEDLQSLLIKSGITLDDLKLFCNYLSESKNTIYAWAMGITHQANGVSSVQMITNLALMRGMLGKPGAGLLPIRGHSNVQGVGTVGVVPKLKPEMATALLEKLKIQVPESAGMDTFSCMQAAHKGDIDFALLLGGNLYAANPDLKWAAEAINRIEFTTFISTTMNLGHIHGRGKNTLILPVRARDEEKQATSQESMFNYVRLSAGGMNAPVANLPAESELFVHLGKELFGDTPLLWSELAEHHKVRKFIAETVPDMHPLAQLDRGHEFTIPGRIKHTPNFNTENKKANLATIKAPDARPQDGFFNLMTMRSEGQFNTIIYEEKDVYRCVNHRRVVFINEQDISSNNLVAGTQVWVESEIGKIQVELVSAPIRAGNVAMYYPEANEIVPGKLDPQSKTPVFKRIPVRIKAA